VVQVPGREAQRNRPVHRIPNGLDLRLDFGNCDGFSPSSATIRPGCDNCLSRVVPEGTWKGLERAVRRLVEEQDVAARAARTGE
jgi:hypothetical protein